MIGVEISLRASHFTSITRLSNLHCSRSHAVIFLVIFCVFGLRKEYLDALCRRNKCLRGEDGGRSSIWSLTIRSYVHTERNSGYVSFRGLRSPLRSRPYLASGIVAYVG